MCIYCTYRVYTVDPQETSWRANTEGRRLGHTDQIKSAIVTGQLAEGEQLPSIRALANSLRVSAITTKRAYADLEAAGLIETVQGKGTYVAGGNAELIREEQMREVEGLLAKAVERGRGVGLTDDELSEMFALVLE